MKNKRGYEFSFAWIFAIIIGAFILFLAVYAATQIIGIKKFEEETKTGKKIGILLNPIATNLEQAKFATIIVPDETIIFNTCRNITSNQPFGSQEISTSVRQGNIKNTNEEAGEKSSFHDRYLFSNSTVKGDKEFYVLSKPFKFPFKIADLMILWSDNEYYCFVDAPDQIKRDIKALDLKNIFNKSDISQCPPGTTKRVCFTSPYFNCDIKVNTNPTVRSVTHGDYPPVYYEVSFDDTDPYALLYAAIFSEPGLYECQVRRLMSKASKLANLYEEKVQHLQNNPFYSGQCNFDTVDFLLYKNSAFNLASPSSNLQGIKNLRDLARFDIEDNNDPLHCKLY